MAEPQLQGIPLRRICIVMMSAIGDAVHVLPVVNAIRRHEPAAHITWILQPGPASLVRGHPAVDEILIYRPRQGVRSLTGIRRELKGRRFDLVLNLQVYMKAGLVTSMVKAPVKLGFDFRRARDLNWLFTTHRIPPHPVQHVQDQYFEFLHALGVDAEPVEWDLGPWPQEQAERDAFVSRFPKPYAVLVVGTSNPQKDWIAERWAEVGDALHERHGLVPVLAGGRSDRELETERILRERMSGPIESTLGVPLRELVWLLGAADLVISLDTGPLHMSVALDRPVIALMGYHNPKRVGPYRKYRDLMVDAYGEPGEDYVASMEHRSDRMQRITVQDVLDRVELWAQRYRGGAA
jgi:heptosyltransferase I